MNILVTGASGLIGSHLVAALHATGNRVIAASRSKPAELPDVEWHAINFASMTSADAWLPYLREIDVVVNCVGIIREVHEGDFDLLHYAAPVAIFAACEQLGRPRVIQISALGSKANASTGYWRSKGRAEDDLRQRNLTATIIRPSLVYGDQGTSSTLFRSLATLPLLAMPMPYHALVQPIHIDDLTSALCKLICTEEEISCELATIGPRAMSMAAYLSALRDGMKAAPAKVLELPLPVARIVAAIAERHPASALTPESLIMLTESADGSNTADAQAITSLLGYAPRDPANFTRAEQRYPAVLSWGLPMMRMTIAALWLITAYVSWFCWPQQESMHWLAACGIPAQWQQTSLLAASLTDTAIGLALMLRYRRWLWPLQCGLVATYTIILTIFLPEFWLHPFGPLSKNIPLLAIMFVMWRISRATPELAIPTVSIHSPQNPVK